VEIRFHVPTVTWISDSVKEKLTAQVRLCLSFVNDMNLCPVYYDYFSVLYIILTLAFVLLET